MRIHHTTLPDSAGADMKTLRSLLPFLWMYRGRVLLALSFLVLAKVANVGIPLVLKRIVDHLDAAGGKTLVLPPWLEPHRAAIAESLDGMTHAQRVHATRSLPRKLFAVLFDAASDAPVPSSRPTTSAT